MSLLEDSQILMFAITVFSLLIPLIDRGLSGGNNWEFFLVPSDPGIDVGT